jgi:hypothetical protein
MARFKRAFVVIFGFVLLGFLITAIPQKNASGQSPAPVTVTNTPLPITGSVSGTVNVRNVPLPVRVTNPISGSVTANISGTPTVNANITNSSLPVNLAAGSTVSVSGSSVSVSNLATSPVRISDVDNPAHNAVIGSCDLSPSCNILFTSQLSATQFSSVPSGFLLVIEMVSPSVDVTPGALAFASLTTVVGNAGTATSFPLTKMGTFNNVDFYTSAQQTRIYANPNSAVTFNGGALTGSGTSQGAGVVVYGYLVKCGPSSNVTSCPPL